MGSLDVYIIEIRFLFIEYKYKWKILEVNDFNSG